MSNPNIEQLTAAQTANTEVVVALMRSAFSGLERLTSLNIAATRELLDTTISNSQKLTTIKDPAELGKLNTAFAQPNLDKWMEYSRSVYELAGQMQKELTSVLQSQYGTFTKNANSVIQKTSSAPVGGDVFAAALQSMLSASTKAFDNMNAITKQLTDITEANVQAASNAAATAVSATAAAAKKSK